MKRKKLVLFASYHKPYKIPKASFIHPVQAGKQVAFEKLPIDGDDSGNNISHLNEFYSELTILYWIWKNFDRSAMEYWGLVHYRRYFCLDTGIGSIQKKKVYNFSESGKELDVVVNSKLAINMLTDLQSYDIILPRLMHTYKRKGVTKSITQHFEEDHSEEDWAVTLDVIREKYPEYQDSFVLFESPKMSFFNMMVTNWKTWDQYCSWLFDVLFEVDKRISKSEDPYQRRVMGFISERLINLFVYHNKLKVKYYPVAVFDKKD
jgi:hypothetical protein